LPSSGPAMARASRIITITRAVMTQEWTCELLTSICLFFRECVR
jgi:hypothetical protein